MDCNSKGKFEKLMKDSKSILCELRAFCDITERRFKEKAAEIEEELLKYRKDKVKDCGKCGDSILSRIMSAEMAYKSAKCAEDFECKTSDCDCEVKECEKNIKSKTLELTVCKLERKRLELESLVEQLELDKCKLLELINIQDMKLKILQKSLCCSCGRLEVNCCCGRKEKPPCEVKVKCEPRPSDDNVSECGTSCTSVTSSNGQMKQLSDIFAKTMIREICRQALCGKPEVECKCNTCGCSKSSSKKKKVSNGNIKVKITKCKCTPSPKKCIKIVKCGKPPKQRCC